MEGSEMSELKHCAGCVFMKVSLLSEPCSKCDSQDNLWLGVEEVIELQSTITDKDAEILRLRSLLKEVKANMKDLRFYTFHAANCVKRSPRVASSDTCDCGYWKARNEYDALMEKLKREGV
jgi:hypothetical protein